MKRLLLLGSVVLAAGSAQAGSKWPVFDTNVTVNPATRQAYGIVSHARNSIDPIERMSCTVFGSSFSRVASCYFNDSKSNAGSCYSTNANVIDAIRFVQSDSYIYLAWDASGQCTSVSVYTDSAYMPKQP